MTSLVAMMHDRTHVVSSYISGKPFFLRYDSIWAFKWVAIIALCSVKLKPGDLCCYAPVALILGGLKKEQTVIRLYQEMPGANFVSYSAK